jgi:hypothetical protein
MHYAIDYGHRDFVIFLLESGHEKEGFTRVCPVRAAFPCHLRIPSLAGPTLQRKPAFARFPCSEHSHAHHLAFPPPNLW